MTTDLDDERLEALASTGGLIGVHFYATYLGPTPNPEDVAKQVGYSRGRIGIDHVALGVNFFPTQGAWYELQAAQGTTELRWAVPDRAGMPQITRALVEHGFGEGEVLKVLGGEFPPGLPGGDEWMIIDSHFHVFDRRP